MTAWITANPISSILLAWLGMLTVLWLLREAWDRITVTNDQEYGLVEEGDFVINVFETKRQEPQHDAGDGVEAGV